MAPRKSKKSQATTSRKRRRDGSTTTIDRVSQRASKHQGIMQSLELMKIALHACLATLFFVRELLPRDVFGWRRLPNLQPGQWYSYDDFIRGKKPEEKKPKYKPTRMMERGLDEATDRILDLLEEGIFEALVRRNLAAIRFIIVTDKTRPDTAVESYTISVDNGAWVLGAELNRGSSEDTRDAALIGDIQKQIVAMSRNLTMLDGAPELPGTRALGVELFYSGDCPKTYQAHGFDDVDSKVDGKILLFPVGKQWSRGTGLCGLINSGFHTAAVRVSWLGCRPSAPWLMVQPPMRHEPGCGWERGTCLCYDMQPVRLPVAFKPPFHFAEIVPWESEIGLPWADTVNEEDRLAA